MGINVVCPLTRSLITDKVVDSFVSPSPETHQKRASGMTTGLPPPRLDSVAEERDGSDDDSSVDMDEITAGLLATEHQKDLYEFEQSTQRQEYYAKAAEESKLGRQSLNNCSQNQRELVDMLGRTPGRQRRKELRDLIKSQDRATKSALKEAKSANLERQRETLRQDPTPSGLHPPSETDSPQRLRSSKKQLYEKTP